MPKKKRKPYAGGRKVESEFETRMENFSEEIEQIGKRLGRRAETRARRIEKRTDEFDSWFHRTLGVAGPLISSTIGVVMLGLLVWALMFVNARISNWFLSDIGSFISTNLGVFFLIFLFFSYTSYFSKFYRRSYMLFSPFSVALAAAICFWIAAHAIDIANLSLGVPVLSQIAFYINQSIFMIFWLLLILGYLVLAIIMATEKTMYREVAHKMPRKSVPVRKSDGIRRLYRSGKDRILGGVCGGIAEYLEVDPVIIRLLWIAISLIWGFGILLYIICWIVIPRNPDHKWK